MDYSEKQDKYNDIMKRMGEDLKPIFDRMIISLMITLLKKIP